MIGIGDTVKIVNDGLVCRIVEPLPKDVTESLSQVLSYKVDGYFFTKAYQLGKWDGKKKLYSPASQSFYAGLLDKVTDVLKKHGIFTNVEDVTSDARPAKPFLFMGNLRHYQQNAMDLLLSHRTGVLQCPPRSGKTVMAAYAIAKCSVSPIVFFVGRLDLAYQTIDELKGFLGETAGLVGDGVVEVKPITVVTMQSAAMAYGQRWDQLTKHDAVEKAMTDKNSVRHLIEQARMCIYDECHHSASPVAQDILSRMGKASYRYGLSATPYREDNADLLIERMLGPIRTHVTYSELIHEGFLVRPHIMMYHMPRYDDDGVYSAVYNRNVVENPERNRIIKRFCERLVAQGRSVVVIVRHVKHGRILKDMIGGSYLLIGSEASDVRNEVRRKIADKELLCCVSTVLDEGVNLPSLDAVVIAEGGKSSIETFQRLRCLTPYPGKVEALVVDFLDKVKYLDSHSKRRLALYKSEKEFIVEEKTLFH